MRDDLDDLLGIDTNDPTQVLAAELVAADDQLMRDLVHLRKQRLTQEDVGRRMGVTQPAVAALERPDADPKLSTIRRYALAVGALVRHTVIDRVTSGPSVTVDSPPPSTSAAPQKSVLQMHPSSDLLSFVQ